MSACKPALHALISPPFSTTSVSVVCPRPLSNQYSEDISVHCQTLWAVKGAPWPEEMMISHPDGYNVGSFIAR